MEVDQQWKNLLDRDVLRDSIQKIALYITVFELLENTIISRPKDFFTIWEWDDEAKKDYKEHVLSLYDPKAIPGLNGRRKDLISSLLWFKQSGALDDDDIRLFVEAKRLRNTLVHQMLESIAKGGIGLAGLFAKLYALFSKIERWWIMEVEVSTSGDIEPDKIDESGVMSGNMIVVYAILDILSNDSNAHFKEICEVIGVPVK